MQENDIIPSRSAVLPCMRDWYDRQFAESMKMLEDTVHRCPECQGTGDDEPALAVALVARCSECGGDGWFSWKDFSERFPAMAAKKRAEILRSARD